MAIGPGVYNHLCTFVRAMTNAEGAIVIVINGNKGNGFACQATKEITNRLSTILRETAEQIEEEGDSYAS